MKSLLTTQEMENTTFSQNHGDHGNAELYIHKAYSLGYKLRKCSVSDSLVLLL